MFVIPSMHVEPDASRTNAALVAAAVQDWEQAGFQRVQLVIGLADQRLPNERILSEVLRDVNCPIQVAGRFEATEEIDAALEAGAEFIVLGTRALDDFEWLASVAD